MLIHLFLVLLVVVSLFMIAALIYDHHILSFLSAIILFSLGMLVCDLEFVWINDAGTVITYHWDTEGYMLWMFWGVGLLMLVLGFFQMMGYTAKTLRR